MKERNSAFEWMRLLAMFMVVLGHCALASAQNVSPYLGTMDNIGWGICSFTGCAVNLFFLLTGFYSNSKSFKLSRIIAVWGKTLFYSVVIYCIVSGVSGGINVKELVGFCMPVFMKKYWYMQSYIVLALLSPFLSLLLEQLDGYRFTFLVGILLVFFSLHESFIPVAYTLDRTQGYGIIWACTMFIIGHWLKKVAKEKVSSIPAMVFLGGYICIGIAMFISNYLIVKYDIASGVASRGNFYAYNSVTVLAQSICLFCYFIRVSERCKTNKTVNWLSKNALSIYLISGHPLLLYPVWNGYLDMKQYWNNPVIYFTVALCSSLLIVFACIIIDKLLGYCASRLGLETYIKRVDKILHFQ